MIAIVAVVLMISSVCPTNYARDVTMVKDIPSSHEPFPSHGGWLQARPPFCSVGGCVGVRRSEPVAEPIDLRKPQLRDIIYEEMKKTPHAIPRTFVLRVALDTRGGKGCVRLLVCRAKRVQQVMLLYRQSRCWTCPRETLQR